MSKDRKDQALMLKAYINTSLQSTAWRCFVFYTNRQKELALLAILVYYACAFPGSSVGRAGDC